MTHSISGGTGSGLGTRLLCDIREQYPDRILETNTVFPSTNVTDSAVEPYNATLSMYHIIENTDYTNVIQNESLYDICSRSLKMARCDLDDFNRLISVQMSDVSSSLRFGGALNTNMRKTLVNICPFPRLHFYVTSLSPLGNLGEGTPFTPTSAAELVQHLFDGTYMM